MASLDRPSTYEGDGAVKKRKKTVKKHPNPLFEEWLTEWRDQAKEKGLKTQFIYGKALKTLQKYPLYFESGKECKILSNFGDKICSMLDGRLKEYISIYGEPSPPDSDSQDDDSTCKRHKTNSGASKEKLEYAPRFRSGPYAIIITLFRQRTENSGIETQFMFKDQLMAKAQPLCDQSFTIPLDGGRYTAWSSMGSLIKKKLIMKACNPAKYWLTQEGAILAEKLILADLGQTENQNLPLPEVPILPSASPVAEALPDFGEVKFDYVDDKFHAVLSKDEAAVTIDPELSLGFLMKCNHSQLIASGYRHKVHSLDEKNTNGVFVYLADADCPAISGSLPARNPLRGPPAISTLLQEKPFAIPSLEPVCALPVKATSNTDRVDVANEKKGKKSKSAYAKSSTNSQIACGSLVDWLRCQNQSPSFESVQSELGEHSSHVPTMFILRPGQFKIVLLVDNHEHFGGSSVSKQILLPELDRADCEYKIVPLNLGDFCWIAKPTDESLSELMLPVIVERKRIDDLASSITDGRFREQKFRLKQSCLAQPVYLVENYGSMLNFSLPEDTLLQSIMNTLIIDQFTVRRTADHRHSIAYLIDITKELQRIYTTQILKCVRREDFMKLSCRVQQKPQCQYLMRFNEFNDTSCKTKPLMAREMLAKQLLVLSGMSVEKVAALVDRYPTVGSLIKSYRSCTSQSQKEAIVAGIKAGPLKRNFGPVLGRAISALYS